MARIIGYERVSTARQGASGLGLEAQRQAITAYALQRDASLIARFTEMERPLRRSAVAQRRLPAGAPRQRGAVLGSGTFRRRTI